MSLSNSNWAIRHGGPPNSQRIPAMGMHHVQKVAPYESPWFQQQVPHLHQQEIPERQLQQELQEQQPQQILHQPPKQQQQQQQTQQPPQDMDVRGPPIYSQQDQQTYWENNMAQNYPHMSLPKCTYPEFVNNSWNQQAQYIQNQQPQLLQMQQQNQQPPQPLQQQFGSSANVYFEDGTNKHGVYNASQQHINYANSNPVSGGDPWNWGWDESSNNSPATSFSANNNFKNDSTWNWNVDDSQEQNTDPKPIFNSAQDYFTSEKCSVPFNQSIQDGKISQIEQLMSDVTIQSNPVKGQQHFSPNIESGFYENQEQSHPNKIVTPPKPEPTAEACAKHETTEKLTTVNLQNVDSTVPVFDVKSEDTQSFNSGSPLGATEMKMERLSPVSGQSCEIAESINIDKSDCPSPFLSRSLTTDNEFKEERVSPEVVREGSGNANNESVDTLIPPPGLDRMVLGQLTENENDAPAVPEVNTHHHPGRHIHLHQSTPPLGLHRLVLGQLTDDNDQTKNSSEENQNLSSLATTDDIPPPDFHRMIPGESSSPETQNVMQFSIDSLPREQRVVTGVARDEIDVGLQSNIATSSPTTTSVNRLSGQPASSEESRIQFQSERCETIGSDNVDNYVANPGDSNPVKQSKRKDNKDRDRHLEDITSDEGERDQSRRREKDSGYYSQRGPVNRERDESQHRDRQRYHDRRTKGREVSHWERDRRSESPGRYRDDKERRRDYRDDRRRHLDQYYSDDDDADTNGYYSDRDQRNMSGYGDEYDRSYSRREDRARSLRPEKIQRDRNDERGSGKDRRRVDYVDRERERERNRDRDRDRDRQSDYYRRRGHDEMGDYGDNQRSRPSSRNDSVHDYKHRGRTDYEDERDRGDRMDRYRGPPKRDRDMFYPGYNFDPAYYNYYYQYCENLRRTNPAAYAEWCRKYYAQSQHGTFDGSYTEDRGSVHSGRSSANDENKDRYTHKDPQVYPCYQTLDQSYPYHSYSSDFVEHDSRRRIDLQMEKNNATSQRVTPAKFSTAHVKGILTPRGQLLKILPHYPLDGQPATLEIHEQLSCYEEMRKELQDFPGPLVRGVTHKNNILKYCKQKIKEAEMNPSIFDKDSYKLMWELLMLLIRQNGTVVGTDIAELLMYDRTAHMSINQSPSGACAANSENPQRSGMSEEEVTNQFRDYLIYGNTREALEWAMKHGLWGHALFLASKMDQRTYANVMTRFANGLTMNDPLQTLYQLMSGRQPASVTCCADEKWGDWRPHLAMILSNSTARPDLDVKTVTTLGDTLGSRGNLHAAHFCYLMAQVEFGMYSQKSSKIVLIGSSHTLPFNQFCTNEAIFATEIFEFACSLADPEFTLHHLQVYKLLIAKRLMEVGLVQEAVHYVELIANTIAKHPSHYSPQFIQEVYDVGNMLKYSDPVYNNSETIEGSNSDPEWLSRLTGVLNDYQMGVLQHDAFGSASNLTTFSENDVGQSLTLDTTTSEPVNENQSWQQQQQPPLPQQPRFYEQKMIHQQQNDANLNGYTQVVHSEVSGYKDQPIITGPSLDDSSQNYWTSVNHWIPPQPQQQLPLQPQEGRPLHESGITDYKPVSSVDVPDPNQQPMYDYFEQNRNEGSKPQITLPNTRQRSPSESSENPIKSPRQRPAPAAKESKKSNQGGSWFGGIFNKLPFKPKNQMILPDDKNPSIVWDSDRNQWVNLDGDESDAAGNPPPPPKSSDLPNSAPISSFVAVTSGNLVAEEIPRSQQQQQHHMPDGISNNPLSGGQNKYKMNRGKSFKSNYVDVMNPGGGAKSVTSTLPAPDLFPGFNYSPQLPSSYMIPAPVEGSENAPTDFLTPSAGPVRDNAEPPQPQALSRWSSTSSLSREVQKYTFKQIRTAKSPGTGGEEYKISNNQWNGGSITNPQRLPTNLPRSKGYMK